MAKVNNHIGSSVNPENRRIYAEVIIGSDAPVAESEVIVIGLPGPVLLLHQGFRLLWGNAHTLCNSLDADFVRSGYEDVKTWTVTENVICATADENGRALVRDGAYDIALDDEQLVVTHVVVCRTEASDIHDETGQCEEISLLVTLGKQFFAEAALLRCLEMSSWS